MTVTVREKSPDKYAPVCHRAELFCALAQSAVLDGHRLDVIRNLGYTVEIIKSGGHNEKID